MRFPHNQVVVDQGLFAQKLEGHFVPSVPRKEREKPAIPRSVLGQIPPKLVVNDNSSSSFSTKTAAVSSNFEAMFVFTIVRHDLLDLHLTSIDYPTDHVFVVLNYASETTKNNMVSVLKSYDNCSKTALLSRQGTCKNPNIKLLHILSSPGNIGFSGNCNTGLKAMMEFNLNYALFSGDDTRFLPQKIRAARQMIIEQPEICMFHFEAYSSFVITREGMRRIGPFDENFWPAYAEDCDYWFRALLVGCSIFYRGGYSAQTRSPRSMQNALVEHGDIKDLNLLGSVTYKSDPTLRRLVDGTLHPTRGRFSYLIRKWGLDTCGYYHEVINKWRYEDEIVAAPNVSEFAGHGARVYHPYDDPMNFSDTRRWVREDWNEAGVISSRAVNHLDAPSALVWQEADYVKLAFHSLLNHSTEKYH